MLSISKTESRIVEFLLRRFSQSFTIRKVSQELKTSPAGAHKAVKKLEAEKILTTERIGASLVCRVNLENPQSVHLSAMLIADPTEKPEYTTDLRKHAKAAILLNRQLLVISEEDVHVPGQISTETITEQEFTLKMLKKDQTMIGFIENGKVLFGESVIVNAIKSRGVL